jgi:hypothetical protein
MQHLALEEARPKHDEEQATREMLLTCIRERSRIQDELGRAKGTLFHELVGKIEELTALSKGDFPVKLVDSTPPLRNNSSSQSGSPILGMLFGKTAQSLVVLEAKATGGKNGNLGAQKSERRKTE